MRYSIIHAVCLTLLGLAIVYPGVNSAPARGLVRDRRLSQFNISQRAPVPPPKFSPSGSKPSLKKGPPGIGSSGDISGDQIGGGSRTFVVDPATKSYKIGDVVDILLQRGADPNFNAGKHGMFTPLPGAASSGSLSMVRKLLDHGAYPNEESSNLDRLPAFWYAVATENTAMMHLLESRGAFFDHPLDGDPEGLPWIGQSAMEMAEELYLDSMFDLLKARGIEIVERLDNTGCAPWQKWGIANNPPRNNPNWANYLARVI